MYKDILDRNWLNCQDMNYLLRCFTGKKSEIHTTKFAIAPQNPYYVHILWKYTIIMDNQNPFYFQ